MKKWLSNSREVLTNLEPEERSSKVVNLPEGTLPMERSLGVCWDAERDLFVFELSLTEREPTRRHILSEVAGIFDPIGLIAPYVLSAKIILQELCRKGMDWDTILTGNDLTAWDE